MIYVCVPVHNEARTAGLVLWVVRQVFPAFPREYELLVLDDASTDDTREVLASYAKVLPMTIVTHGERRGYARSLEELLRLALQRTDRPKRDCAITLHADFVHSPERMEDMVKHLESGADLVVAELVEQRGRVSRAQGLARRWTPRLLRVAGLRDTVSRTDSTRADSAKVADTTARTAAPVGVPFPVGERLVYGARYGPFSVGTATMQVAGIDTVRGVEAVHFVFLIDGGALWYHIHQNLESWVGRHDFRSRRFLNQTEEKGKTWERKFEIYPDSGFYREAGRDTTVATVTDPLDDAAFLYWIRTVPLEVGKRYEYRRYFRPERNPVIVEVLKRERVGVAGKDLRTLARQLAKAAGRRGVVAMLGGHVIKVGLGPLFGELIRRGVITHLALNGSAAIHDFELAAYGGTSEDVAAGLADGTFGMVEETGREMNAAIAEGARAGRGLGEALVEALRRRAGLAAPEASLLVAALERDVPVTVHAAVGADIIHQHPTADGAALGATSHRDFKRLAASL